MYNIKNIAIIFAATVMLPWFALIYGLVGMVDGINDAIKQYWTTINDRNLLD